MKNTYSLYEAKARLSALVRMVRDGHRVIITVHGEPAAELRPVEVAPAGIEARVANLVERGIVTAPTGARRAIKTGNKRPGAIKRFLASRD